MTEGNTTSHTAPEPQILFVEADIIVRSAIAAYLRECGYTVIEAVSSDEAMAALRHPDLGGTIDIVFADVETPGSVNGFGLSTWVAEHRRDVRVVLAATVPRAAKLATHLCEEGPHLRKPYDTSLLLDAIKRLRGGH